MRKILELRVDERYAPLVFGRSEGKRLGDSVRKVQIESDDPRMQQIEHLQRELREKRGEPFYYGWQIRCIASPEERNAAALFTLHITTICEPSGEESGTKYDESLACPLCGAGAKQLGPLIFNPKKMPKGKDILKTIAGEILVSRKLVELLNTIKVTGTKFGPIQMNAASSAQSKDWLQLFPESTEAKIVPPTRIGIDPFDEDQVGKYRCGRGDLLGLNLLTEVTILDGTQGSFDLAATSGFVGVRRGVLRPERVILVSPRTASLIESQKVKGVRLEAARVET